MAFDLGELLKNVSNSDTGREQIEYISLDLIDEDPNNFYQLSDIPLLADNISLCGLQQPIRVRQQENGRYKIVSGHRRRAAMEMLVADGYDQWKEAPCIVEQDSASPTLQQLRLIYANANTRKMSSAELSEQALQVEKLLYQLKEEGYDFPGRMRDHVAEAVCASKTKLARLKVIRENLAKCWLPLWKRSNLSESTAYELAQLSEDCQQLIYDSRKSDDDRRYMHASTVDCYAERFQRIEKLKCKKTKNHPCENRERKFKKAVEIDRYTYFHCSSCCSNCSMLTSCRYACPKLADLVKKLRAENKEKRQANKIAQEKKDKPTIEFIQDVYSRIGAARAAAQVSARALFNAQGKFCSEKGMNELEELEAGTAKVTTSTELPFGHSFNVSMAEKLIKVGDVLNCSIDYLLGRTEQMELAPDPGKESQQSASNSGTTWQTGEPKAEGQYILLLGFGRSSYRTVENWEWDERHGWHDGSQLLDLEVNDGKVLGWIPMPKQQEPPKSALNGACITGMSPTGHCGAAACCGTEYACCLQCAEDCNFRCGWIEDVEAFAENEC